MGKYERQRAVKKRRMLLEVLGNRCVKCGSMQDLEIDVISPIGNRHHRKIGSADRIYFYIQQWKLDNIQCLCAECNGRKKDFEIDFRPAWLKKQFVNNNQKTLEELTQ